MSAAKGDEDRLELGTGPVVDLPRPTAPAVAIDGPAEVSAQIERHLARCRRHRTLLALVCVSVERIQAGGVDVSPELESLVREGVAQRVRNRVRATDRVLRECERDACVLLPGGTDEAAHRVAARFAKALNGTYRVGAELVLVTVRVGCASHPHDGWLASDLLRRATARIEA